MSKHAAAGVEVGEQRLDAMADFVPRFVMPT
jgi:hypothetical protein